MDRSGQAEASLARKGDGGTSWRRRVEGAGDSAELDESVRDAIISILSSQPGKPLPQDQLVALFESLLARVPDLERRKKKAVQALEVVSQLSLAAGAKASKAANNGDAAPEPAKPRIKATVKTKKKVTIKKKVVAKKKPAPTPEPDGGSAEHQARFEAVFVDSLCDFVKQRLELFQVQDRPESPLPFILSPGFADNFIKAVKAHLAPTLLEHRQMRLLSQTLGDDDLTEETFFAQFDLPERENVVRLLWNDRWDEYRRIITEGVKAEKAAAKDQKAGGLKGLIGKLRKENPKLTFQQSGAAGARAEKAQALWKALTKGAAAKVYEAPKPDDILLFQAVFDFPIQSVNEGKTGVRQMLKQEKTQGGDGREGSTRQYLCDRVRQMPPHCGELLALWAYYACGSDFDVKMLKAFTTSYGTTPQTRRAALPFFMRWTPSV